MESVAESLRNLTLPSCEICDATDATPFGGRSLVTTSCTPPHRFHLDCIAKELVGQCQNQQGERLCVVCSEPTVLPLNRASVHLAVDACRYGDLDSLSIALQLEPAIAEEKIGSSELKHLYDRDNDHPVGLAAIAARHGHIDCVRQLMNASDKFADEAFYCAAGTGHVRVMDCLINEHLNPKADKETLQGILDKALQIAAGTDQHESIKYLVEKGASDFKTALCKATTCGFLESMKLLIGLGANSPDALNQSLLIATTLDRLDAFGLLLKSGADALDPALLASALWTDSPLCMQHLMDMGLDINDINGAEYPLIMCENSVWQPHANSGLCRAREDYFTDALKRLGVSVDQGETILQIAIQLESTNCLPILIRNGADINATDNQGFSALHWCTLTGNTNCAQILIKAEANINAKSHRGETALHLAARLGNLEYLAKLISAGADINATDIHGATAIDFASHEQCYQQLLNRGAMHGGQLLQKARAAEKTNGKSTVQTEDKATETEEEQAWIVSTCHLL